MDKIDEIIEGRKVAHARLTKAGSKVYKAFLAMEEAAFSDGALPKKAKELIAVGISVVIDCESCMQWHIEQAGRPVPPGPKSWRRSRWESRWVAARQRYPQGSPSTCWSERFMSSRQRDLQMV